MKGEVMSRKKKEQAEPQLTMPLPGRESPIAGPCSMCAELLVLAARKQNTRVAQTRGNVRYCECRNCGHTWKRVS